MVALTSLAALVAVFAAGTTARNCKDITIPVTISSTNQVFDLKAPSSNIEVADFILNLLKVGGNYPEELLKGNKTVSGSYKIAATYCEPEKGPSKTVQVLTHGIGFDRTYWDFSINNYNYSYVNRALERGYSALFYDRLGLGKSSRGEPVNEIQSALEVASLRALTEMLRKGNVPQIKTKFEKVIHVGHSFGSAQTYGLAAKYPDLTDGIVLTGFTLNPTYVPLFTYSANFVLAKTLKSLRSYPNGYFALADKNSVHRNFFSSSNLDPEVLAAAADARQPVSVGELLTTLAPASTVNKFEGPVLVVTGDYDLAFCGGNCTPRQPSIPGQVQNFFPNASNFEAVVIPHTGHGLNLEYTHPTTYDAILGFLDKHI